MCINILIWSLSLTIRLKRYRKWPCHHFGDSVESKCSFERIGGGQVLVVLEVRALELEQAAPKLDRNLSFERLLMLVEVVAVVAQAASDF